MNSSSSSSSIVPSLSMIRCRGRRWARGKRGLLPVGAEEVEPLRLVRARLDWVHCDAYDEYGVPRCERCGCERNQMLPSHGCEIDRRGNRSSASVAQRPGIPNTGRRRRFAAARTGRCSSRSPVHPALRRPARAQAACLLEWFRLRLRHGWIVGHNRVRDEDPFSRNGSGGHSFQGMLVNRRKLHLHIPTARPRFAAA